MPRGVLTREQIGHRYSPVSKLAAIAEGKYKFKDGSYPTPAQQERAWHKLTDKVTPDLKAVAVDFSDKSTDELLALVLANKQRAQALMQKAIPAEAVDITEESA